MEQYFGANHNEESNEIKHYGVIGMKWGVHRAAKKGETYTYKSHGTKSYARRAKKAREKGDIEKAKKYENYHKRSVELDSRMQKNAEKQNALLGITKFYPAGINSRTYEATRAAMGNTPISSRLAGGLNSIGFGALGGTPVRAAYVRVGEDGRKRAEKVLKKMNDMEYLAIEKMFGGIPRGW